MDRFRPLLVLALLLVWALPARGQTREQMRQMAFQTNLDLAFGTYQVAREFFTAFRESAYEGSCAPTLDEVLCAGQYPTANPSFCRGVAVLIRESIVFEDLDLDSQRTVQVVVHCQTESVITRYTPPGAGPKPLTEWERGTRELVKHWGPGEPLPIG